MVKGPGSVKTGVELPRRDVKSQAKSADSTESKFSLDPEEPLSFRVLGTVLEHGASCWRSVPNSNYYAALSIA